MRGHVISHHFLRVRFQNIAKNSLCKRGLEMTFENSIIVRVCCIFKDYHVAILFQFFYEACIWSLNNDGPVNINLISLGKNYTIHHLSAPTKQQHLPYEVHFSYFLVHPGRRVLLTFKKCCTEKLSTVALLTVVVALQ